MKLIYYNILKYDNVFIMNNIEATIIKVINLDYENIYIECNPKPLGCYLDVLFLKKKYNNFIELYNKIIPYKTYNFTYHDDTYCCHNECVIIDILPLIEHKICTTIKGFLNVGNESKSLSEFQEIMIYDNNRHRLLIHEKHIKSIMIGNKYIIYYKKAFGIDLYRVFKIKLCTNI